MGLCWADLSGSGVRIAACNSGFVGCLCLARWSLLLNCTFEIEWCESEPQCTGMDQGMNLASVWTHVVRVRVRSSQRPRFHNDVMLEFHLK